MSEAPELKTKSYGPAMMILLTGLAWVYFGSVLPFGLFSEANIPEEFKTVYLASNQISITALLSLFHGDAPLYYVAAHFACFFQNTIFALKTLSYIFVGAAACGAFLLINEMSSRNGGAAKIFFTAIYAPLLPLVYLGFLAIPAALSVCLLVLSFLFLDRIIESPTPWRQSLYIACTAGFCFSCHFGFLVPVLQYFCFLAAGRGGASRIKSFRSIFFWAVASAVASGVAFQRAVNYSWHTGGIKKILLEQFSITSGSPGIVLYLLLSVMFASAILLSLSGAQKTQRPLATALFVISLLASTASAIFNPVLAYSRNEINSHNKFIVSLIDQRNTAGQMLVAAVPGTPEMYYMILQSVNLPSVFIYPDPLKPDFPKPDTDDINTYGVMSDIEALPVKEALLGAKVIHVIGDAQGLCNSGAGSCVINSIMPYIEPSKYQPGTNIDCSTAEPERLYYMSYVLKDNVSRDEIIH